MANVPRCRTVCADIAPCRLKTHQELTEREIRALSDFDDVTVRIPDVAADFAVLGCRFRDEFGSSTFPHFITRFDIRNPQVHEAVDVIRVGDAQRNGRLVRGRSSANVQNHPGVRKLKVPRRVAVTQAQNPSTEHLFVVASGSVDVRHGEKMRDADPLSRGHLIGLLLDDYVAHAVLGPAQAAATRTSSEQSRSKKARGLTTSSGRGPAGWKSVARAPTSPCSARMRS